MSTPLHHGSAIAAVLLLGITSWTLAAEPDEFLQHLPDGSLVAVRVAKLDAMDEQLSPLAERFGLAYPPLGQLVTALEGVDSRGDAVIGLMWRDDAYAPFALVPVLDFSAFVRAADGDGDSQSTLVTLAGEDLVATRRDRWALLTNLSGSEEPRPLGNLTAGELARVRKLLRSEDYSVVVLPEGIDRIPATSTRRVSSRQRAQYRRRIHNGPFALGDPTFWLNALEVYRESLTHFSRACDGLALGATLGDNDQIALRIAVLAREQNSEAAVPTQTASHSGPENLPALAGQPAIFAAAGTWKSNWTELMLDLYLYSFAGGSDGFGIRVFSKSALQEYVESTRAASELVQQVSTVMVAPTGDLPVMSNTGIILHTSDAQEYLREVDRLVEAWNQAVQKSKGDADYVYEKVPEGIAGLAPGIKGQRYQVDLTTAFRMENVPDVRTMFDKMYGRNGKAVMDVVAIDGQRVLVSDLPDDLRNQLQQELLKESASDQQDSTVRGDWKLVVQPDVFQDWANQRKLISHGGEIVGWEPKPLASQTPVEIEVRLEPTLLEAKATLAGDLVQAVGELVNPSN